MSQLERADIVVAQLRPRQVWDIVASSDRQFIMIGDSDHRNPGIMAHLAPVVSVLAFDGVKHLALEWAQHPYQGIITAFNGASATKRSSHEDLADMERRFIEHAVPETGGNEKLAERFRALNCAMLYTCRERGVQLHAINSRMALADVMPDEPLERQQMFERAYRHHYIHEKLPEWLSPEDGRALIGYANEYIAYNFSLDPARAHRLVKLAGEQRAAIMFGSQHFRGPGQGGIDDFIPAERQVHVLLGDSSTVQRYLENDGGYKVRQPDFVVATDLAMAWVTPVAVKNGLY